MKRIQYILQFLLLWTMPAIVNMVATPNSEGPLISYGTASLCPFSLMPPDLQWNHLGPGLQYTVHEIAIKGTDVYAGGNFLDAGGNANADYLARWDGCQWHALGPGLNGEVRAIAFSGDDVYVGGSFTLPFPNIARWDGVQWYPMDTLPGEIVNSIAIENGNLFAAGGTWNSGFVVQWSGNDWTTLGPALNGVVQDLVIDGRGYLYAGGRFSDVGGNQDADGVILWDENVWQNVGQGVQADIFIGVWDLVLYEDVLFAGGVFVSAGGDQDAHAVIKWDSSEWINIGYGLGGFLGLHALTVFNGSLFTTVGAGWSPEDGVYQYDFVTENWNYFQPVELGADDPMLVLAADAASLYVGSFSGMVIDGTDYVCITRWGISDYIVTNTLDAGPGSLRNIVACAPPGTTISFDLPSLSQIILLSGEIDINKDLTIAGPGVLDLAITGNHSSRIFNLQPGQVLTVKDITLRDASSTQNGGAIFAKGDLILWDVLFENNFEGAMHRAFTLNPGIITTFNGNVMLQY